MCESDIDQPSSLSLSTPSDDFRFLRDLRSSSPETSSQSLSASKTPPVNHFQVPRSSEIEENDDSDSEVETNSHTAWKDNFLSDTDTESDEESIWQDSFSIQAALQEADTGCFGDVLEEFINDVGVTKVAASILDNDALKDEITKLIFSEAHANLKLSLKKSILSTSKQDRSYLLSLSPKVLCQEFHNNSNSSFQLLSHGLLGVSDPQTIFDSQHLLNTVSLLYSTVAKTINRKATGYALLLTTIARDGGLREDSIKIFSPMVTPRTSQRYDKSVLSSGWDVKLRDCLQNEKSHFEEQKKAEENVEKLLHDQAATEVVDAAKAELELLIDNAPKQCQVVWDNLNLRTKHREERSGDNYSDANLDWMSSLMIKDRINSDHMEHNEGVALKDIEHLSIKDFVPSDKEKDYIFSGLVHYFSHRLVERHPLVFQSIAKCIKPCRPHQFQEAMSEKSREFTGTLYTKSESQTEDLIEMMADVQINVHTFEDLNGAEHCFERKIVSGDNKTEKNMHYGILR